MTFITCAGSTHKRQEGFLEFPPPNTFPSTVRLALGCNTTVSLHATVHPSDSFNTISVGFKLDSLVLGNTISSKFLELIFLVDFTHSPSTLSFWERFWKIETWVIRPRHFFRLHSSKSESRCDNVTKSEFWSKHTLIKRLPKSNLSCLDIKKFNPIMPYENVGNF